MEMKLRFLVLTVPVFILVLALSVGFVISLNGAGGICVPKCTTTAYDDDGGDEPLVRGVCTEEEELCEDVSGFGDFECILQEPASFVDSCSGNILTEYYPDELEPGEGYCDSRTYDCQALYGIPCQNGFCGCTDECSDGARRCSGDNLQECRSDWDADTCLEWGTIQDCTATGEMCQGGQCVADPGTCEYRGCWGGGQCVLMLEDDNCNRAEYYFATYSTDFEACGIYCIDGDVDLGCTCEQGPPCTDRACGTTCPDTGVGICNGLDACYPGGGCFLDCTPPDPGANNKRVWPYNTDCGRTGSYTGANQICSNSVSSCQVGGTPTGVPGTWVGYFHPEYANLYYFKAGDVVPIYMTFVTPHAFNILSESRLVRPNGTYLYVNNWGTTPCYGSGCVYLSYTLGPEDPEGTWTLDYTGTWSDFETNQGWRLQIDNTDYDFIVDNTPPAVSVTGAPASWTKTDAAAGVGCSDALSGCNASTRSLTWWTSDPPATCPQNYEDYLLWGWAPVPTFDPVSQHMWFCAAAKDKSGNAGFSPAPVEFKVEQELPTTTISPNGLITSQTSVDFTLTCSDTGGSGCSQSYFRVTGEFSACGTSGYTAGNSGTVTGTGKKKVCFYSRDVAGNQDSIKTRIFELGAPSVATDDDGGNVPEVPGTCSEKDVQSECLWYDEFTGECMQWDNTTNFFNQSDSCSGLATITEYFPDATSQFCTSEAHDCGTFDECNPAAACPGPNCVYHEYWCAGESGLCGNGVCDPGEDTNNCKHDCCKAVCNAINSEDACVYNTQDGCNCSWPFRGITPIPLPTCNCATNGDCATGYCRLSASCAESGGNIGLCATPQTGNYCYDCAEQCPGISYPSSCNLDERCYWVDDTVGCKCSAEGYILSYEEASCDYYAADPDTQQGYCDACLGAGSWNIGGDVATCCGDDSYDNVTIEQSSTDAPAGYNDGGTACCDSASDCQNDDTCYDAGSDDDSAWCCDASQESGCSATYWYGPDAFASACTALVGANLWNVGGDVSACCGDDANEHYNYVLGRHTGDYYDVAWLDDPGIDACCDSPDDCVDLGGNCRADHESASGFNPGGNDNISVCEWGPGNENWWFDCDYNSESCGNCNLNWTPGGEGSAFGEYDTGTSTECCMDDASEYYKPYNRYTGDTTMVNLVLSTEACCGASSRCVDKDGNCVPQNTAGWLSSSAVDDRVAACGGGTYPDAWLDCDYSEGRCGYCNSLDGISVWVGSGESGVGEYGSSTDGGDGTTECCGDDADEAYRTREAGTDSTPTYADNPGDDTCCSAATDCVYALACFNSGSTSGSIPTRNYCNAGTWEGGDAGSTQCGAIVGAGYWNLGGDVAPAACCGDDFGENKRTCQDNGVGACAESADDEACCSDSGACVYDGVCYPHGGATPNGNWICDQGTWDILSVAVSVTATPDSAKSAWQNTDATAGISCTTQLPAVCDPNTYRLYTSTTQVSGCPTDYDNDYALASPQTISSHVWVCGAAKNNFGTVGFSAPVEFLVDQESPIASLDALGGWTNQTSVIVGWSGSDTGGSGIDYFELQYRVTTVDGSEIQEWTAWGSNPNQNGSLPFSSMQNNRTYQFRARARDNAGNTGDWSSAEGISVDLVAPSCSVSDLPVYVLSSAFTVSWSGSDWESGIQYYDVQSREEGGTWEYMNGGDGFQTNDTSDDMIGTDDHTYFFRCRATDLAGNLGGWSAEEDTTVDATDPSSYVQALKRWINVTYFTVSWTGSDQTSGIDCYHVNWSSDGSTWPSWFECTTLTSATFGPDSPAAVTEGTTYYFKSASRDNAGRDEDWPADADTLTTIDMTPPGYALSAYDQDGSEIMGYVSPERVSSITLELGSTDSVSGVEHAYLEYVVILSDSEYSGSVDCGQADPYGGLSECNVTIDFANGVMVEFWARVTDRAGNGNVSDVLQIGTHPLANFGKHTVHMSMGESALQKVYVRNMRDQVDNVTVTVSSDLPVSPRFIGLADLRLIGGIWTGNGLELSNNNRTLVVYNLNPGATLPPFNLRLWSSEPPEVYYLRLDALSAMDPGLTDADQALVQISYPASFPGLNEWAIIILIVLAVAAYFWFERRKK
jgi:hypothetical protein